MTSVMLPGVAWAAVVMTLIYLLGEWNPKFYLMGLYGWYIIPIGALIVGLLTGSGYGLFSWLKGIKVVSAYLWAVAALQLLTYVVAQYQEYKHIDPRFDDGTAVPFLVFFDYATQSFSWQNKNGTPGTPIGLWGYGMRLLELSGFVYGGVIPLWLLGNRAYCDTCRRYHKTRQIGVIPAGAKYGVIAFGEKKQKHLAENQAAFETGVARVEQMLAAASQNDVETIMSTVTTDPKQIGAANDLSHHFTIQLSYCPDCNRGSILAALMKRSVENSSEKQVSSAPLAESSVASLLERMTSRKNKGRHTAETPQT